MALKPPKMPLQPFTEAEATNPTSALCAAINLEDLLADSLLESIDWSKVKALMIEKAQSKFWAWISSVSPASDVSLALLPDAIAIGAIGEVNND